MSTFQWRVNKLYVSYFMQAIVDPVYYKQTVRISPGVVGTVGDAVNGVRLKQSAPDMKMRYDKSFSGSHGALLLGSNVQDGFSRSETSGGMNATVIQKHLPCSNGFKHGHGWRYQDLRAPDTLHEPLLAPTERYSWRNKIATIYEAKRTGDMFLPLPGPYGPTSLPRGGQVPRIVDSSGELYDDISAGIKAGSLYKDPNLKEALNDLNPNESVVQSSQKVRVCKDASGKIIKVEPM